MTGLVPDTECSPPCSGIRSKSDSPTSGIGATLARSAAVQAVAETRKLVLDKRVQGIEDQRPDGSIPGLSPAIRVRDTRGCRKFSACDPAWTSDSTSPTALAEVQAPPTLHATPGLQRSATIGNRKHSVLPDPVPVVTTTSLPLNDRLVRKTPRWCVYNSRRCPFGRTGGKSPCDGVPGGRDESRTSARDDRAAARWLGPRRACAASERLPAALVRRRTRLDEGAPVEPSICVE